MHKSKDKMKGNIAKKVLRVRRGINKSNMGNYLKNQGQSRVKESIVIDFAEVEDDEKEKEEEFLYEEKDCAIANFCLSYDACSGMGKPDPILWHKLNKTNQNSTYKPNQKENPKKKLKNL